MARKKSSANKHFEPGGESQDHSEEGWVVLEGGRVGHGVASKAGAIRRTLAKGLESYSAGTAYPLGAEGIGVGRRHSFAVLPGSRAHREPPENRDGT